MIIVLYVVWWTWQYATVICNWPVQCYICDSKDEQINQTKLNVSFILVPYATAITRYSVGCRFPIPQGFRAQRSDKEQTLFVCICNQLYNKQIHIATLLWKYVLSKLCSEKCYVFSYINRLVVSERLGDSITEEIAARLSCYKHGSITHCQMTFLFPRQQ
jgi:hypothetical protein